jgi:spore maturation protein CgeB
VTGPVIGVVGPVFPDSFADNVLTTLRCKGAAPVELGSALLCPKWRLARVAADFVQRFPRVEETLQSALVRNCRERNVEVVLALESTLLPDTVERLHKQGCAVALWFPDAVVNLDRQLMFLARYDKIFFKEPRLVERVRTLIGAPAEYLPEACNPVWHRPTVGTPPALPRGRAVVVAGNMYPFRVRLLERLSSVGIPLEIYGPEWAKWLNAGAIRPYFEGRYLAREEKATVFRNAAVVLNHLHPSEIDGVNCRLFEAAGCGAAVLTEARPLVETYFSVGPEIATFDSFGDLVGKIRWLLSAEEDGRAMGDRAAARAHAEHTYEHRLDSLFSSLGVRPW